MDFSGYAVPFPSQIVYLRGLMVILGHVLYLVDIFELFLSLHLFLSFLLAFSFINKNNNLQRLHVGAPDT